MTNSEGLCRAIREEGLLIRLLDGELPPNEEHRILTHLRTCHECLGLTADLLYSDTRLKDLFDRQQSLQAKQKKKVLGQFLLEVDKLPVGRSLGRDLLDEDGNLLVAAGTELTPGLIETLKTRGVEKLAIEPITEDSGAEPDDIKLPVVNMRQIEGYLLEAGVEPAISDFVRKQCIQVLSSCFASLEDEGELDLKEVHESAQHVTEEILSRPQTALAMTDMILVDPSLHAHSMNVLTIFLVISRAMGHPAQLIREHSTSALLHDIGRIVLRRSANTAGVRKNMDDEDREHTEAGYSYLWNMGGFKEGALKMVMNHHERYDGMGYPRNLKGTQLSDWDQILILANTYDHLTCDKKTGLRSGFHNALATIIQDGSKYVRKGIVRAAIQTLGHYPPGSWVRINNGEIALVTKAQPGSPLKPQVSVIYDASGNRHSRPHSIDLNHTQNTYILGPVSVEMTV